ncbi:Imm53 family immunity protein [Brevibacillus reuszeri]
MEIIKWLENYYSSNCDGDWEHGYGIRVLYY